MTAAGIPYFVIGLAVLSMLYIALGPGVDALNEVHQANLIDSSIPMSSERADTWSMLMLVHDNIMLVVFIGLILLLVMVSIAVHTGPTY